MSTNRTNLTLELHSANGSSAEFYEADPERIRAALHLLAAPQLFAQPHLLLTAQHYASLIPCKGIDMLRAHTSAVSPLKFPLDIPAGQFDIVEQQGASPDGTSSPIEARAGQPCQRDLLAEIHTLGGWTVTLKVMAMFHGSVQDERQFFLHLPNLPTIPFRLPEGGFGLINTANIVHVSAWPKPDMLPPISLPFELRRLIPAGQCGVGSGMFRR